MELLLPPFYIIMLQLLLFNKQQELIGLSKFSHLFRLQRFVGSFSWSEKRQDASFLPGNVKSSCSYIHIDQLVI